MDSELNYDEWLTFPEEDGVPSLTDGGCILLPRMYGQKKRVAYSLLCLMNIMNIADSFDFDLQPFYWIVTT
jgi:hypothetical protein